jgi:hypothetical protein
MEILFIYWALLGIIFEIIGGVYIISGRNLKQLGLLEKFSTERKKGLIFLISGFALNIVGIIFFIKS